MTVTRILSCASRWVLSPPFHLICQSALSRHSQGKQLSCGLHCCEAGGIVSLNAVHPLLQGDAQLYKVVSTSYNCTLYICTKYTDYLMHQVHNWIALTNPLVQKSYLAYSTIGIDATAG